jgi:TetR/AcrR family transcriptional regulator, transcriptional repressor for nem operon
MRYRPGHRQQSRERILEAASRSFRTAGYNGVGVDGLAKAAGLTSGAFYGHFRSKAEAFRAAVVAGLQQLLTGVKSCRRDHGSNWVAAFADFYLSQKVTCGPGESCALPSLSPEVARADETSRLAYQDELLKLVDAITAGLPATDSKKERRKAAWALLAQLAGAVMMARAVADPKLATEIATAVRKHIDANPEKR